MKVCIVSSCGGHLTEVRCLKSVYDAYEHFYVLNDNAILPEDMKDKTYFITHSERDLRFFINLWEAFKIIRRERPDVILSTGAGPVVPFAILARLLSRTLVIYIEPMTQVVSSSLTGRIMHHLAHHFFYQWESLAHLFPKGKYGGTLI